jgi:flagella basal body P-ring formation protein FlgA
MVPSAGRAGEPVVRAGQNVRLEVRGPGFRVGGEGTAMTAAAAGQSVRVRLQSGQIISGTVVRPGLVELTI